MKKLLSLILCLLLVASLCHARAFVQDGTWKDGVTLDGTKNQYVSLPVGASVKGLTQATTECWVKFNSLPVGAVAPAVWWEGTNSGVATRWALFIVENTSDIRAAMRDSAAGTLYITGTYTVSAGRWYHVAATIDTVTTDYLNLYVNNVLVASDTTAKGAFTVESPNFGPYLAAQPSATASVSIRNFRIWNYARTASEIQQQASLRLTGNERGLVYYAPLDQGLNEDPTLPSGVFGSSYNSADVLSLNGSSDKCDVTATVNAYPFTMGAWFVPPSTVANNDVIRFYVASSAVNTAFNGITLKRSDSTSSTNWCVDTDWASGSPSFNTSITGTPLSVRAVHVATVFESVSSRTTYIGGLPLVSSTALTDAPKFNKIGLGDNPGGSPVFGKGGLRNAFFYSRALTQPEIVQCMNSSTPPTTTALIGWWPLNETAGSVAVDLSPNHYDGVITGGSRVSLTPKTVDPVSFKTYPAFSGRYGVAKTLKYDGVNDTTSTGTGPTVLGASAATICCWVIPTAKADAPIVFESIPGNSTLTRLGLFHSASPGSSFAVGWRNADANPFVSITSPNVFRVGIPIFLTAIYDADRDVIEIYENAVLATSSPQTLGAFPSVVASATYIGGTSNMFGSDYVWNVGKWSRALTPAEIQQQMYMDSPVSYQNLLGFWKMDEGTGNCADISGNGNTATVTGATWSVLPNNNGSITNSSTSWVRTLINAFPPSFRSYLVTP